MTLQPVKRRPLSRYIKDFKHMATHCAHCNKVLDRVTLTRAGLIVNKMHIARLDTQLDEVGWQAEKPLWAALCRFCGDLHSKEQNNYFDIIGFKRYLFEQTEMSPGTIREYVVRLRRLGNYLTEHYPPQQDGQEAFCLTTLSQCLPQTSTNNYLIALRKYDQFYQQRTG